MQHVYMRNLKKNWMILIAPTVQLLIACFISFYYIYSFNNLGMAINDKHILGLVTMVFLIGLFRVLAFINDPFKYWAKKVNDAMKNRVRRV